MEDDSGSSILVISCESGSSARVENKNVDVDDLVSLFLLFSFVYRGLEFYLLVILDIMGQSLT